MTPEHQTLNASNMSPIQASKAMCQWVARPEDVES